MSVSWEGLSVGLGLFLLFGGWILVALAWDWVYRVSRRWRRRA